MTLLTAPLLFAAISSAACLAGNRLLAWMFPREASTRGGLLYSLALGFGLIAYLLALAGIFGKLNVLSAVLILLFSALMGLGRARVLAELVRGTVRTATNTLASPGRQIVLLAVLACMAVVLPLSLLITGVGGSSVLWIAAIALASIAGLALVNPSSGIPWLLVVWLLVTFLAALAPPADNDWDGLAEHLAQAKIYARTGHYAPLWYDHHSHFPAVPQLLFSLGMLFQGPGLAKLFHWAFGCVALGSAWLIARRHLGRESGPFAALTFAGTPLVGWLMQVGYVDLSTTALGLLALSAFLDWRSSRETRTLVLAGVLCGLMMATKMQGIPQFGIVLIAVTILALRGADGPGRALRPVLLFGLLAGTIASPWYIKTWVLTGNPVYPFAYSVFGGKYWGPDEAKAYEYHQREFGVGSLPPSKEYFKLSPSKRRFLGPRAPLNMLLAPLNLTVNPVPFEVHRRQGSRAALPTFLQYWIGPLYLLGLGAWFLLALAKSPPPETRRTGAVILWMVLPLWLWWVWSMQLSRYALPTVALLAPVIGAAWANLRPAILRAVPTLWLAVAVGMAAYIAAPALSVTLGLFPEDAYLRAMCQPYQASRVLSELVPEGKRAILYGEPRGYYIDCDYLWGDAGHHRLIPYDRLTTAQTLIDHLRSRGITHVLLNLAQLGVWGPEAGPPVSLLHEAWKDGLARTAAPDRVPEPYLILEIQ
ncbi:MAG: glycosyltransferase family 39 protein [Armatimonadetes bacterium]|nr:glycosyltransferase family 39 protein [Armatimonadota bacterium]